MPFERKTKSCIQEQKLFGVMSKMNPPVTEWLLRDGFDVIKDERLELFVSEKEGLYKFWSENLNVYEIINAFKEDFNGLNVFFTYDEDEISHSYFREFTKDMKTSVLINKITDELSLLKNDVRSEFNMYMSTSVLTRKCIKEMEVKNTFYQQMKKMDIKYLILTHDNYFTSFNTFNREQILQCIDYTIRGNLYNILKVVLPELSSEVKEHLFSIAKKGIVSDPIGSVDTPQFKVEDLPFKYVWEDFQKSDEGMTLRLYLGRLWDGKCWHSKDEFEKAYLIYDGINWSLSANSELF